MPMWTIGMEPLIAKRPYPNGFVQFDQGEFRSPHFFDYEKLPFGNLNSHQEAVDQELRKRFKVLDHAILSNAVIEPLTDHIYRYDYEVKRKDEKKMRLLKIMILSVSFHMWLTFRTESESTS